MNRWMLNGVFALGLANLVGCGAVCGDALTEAPEVCDDANAVAGDGCSDLCEFEKPAKDYRISELELFDENNFDRFNTSNVILASAIGTSDLATALNILIKIGDPEAASTTLDFGPGTFIEEQGIVDIFDADPAATAQANISITNGVFAFDAPTDIILPITTDLATGEFAALSAQNALFGGSFARQGGDGIDVKDILDDGILTAQLAVLDLCAINIIVAGSPVNLLDAFDDGTPSNDSSIVPPPGTAPDATNCQPCLGAGAVGGCTLPENDPDGTAASGDELYNVSATFKAKDDVLIN